MKLPSPPVEVFFSYAQEDRHLMEQLERHLSVLRREGVITTWHKRQISAGSDWQVEWDVHLNTAFLILLLISPDFLASDNCFGMEMRQALRRHTAGQALVIPIIVRAVDWKEAPFAHLQALPTGAKAITSWSNQDEAWADVARGIRKTLEGLLNETGNVEKSVPEERLATLRSKTPQRLAPFPDVWNVPYRYTYFFTGREGLVEDLFANFTSEHLSSTVPIQALSGFGGIGKTQTAVEYAYRYRQNYRAVLWMRAETEEDLLASFKTAAELLKRPASHLRQAQSLLVSIHEWFQQTTDWLLILDNADNLALVEPFIPPSVRGHILLTTRATALGQLAQPLALPPLAPDDGALCILKRANYVPWTAQLSAASNVSVKAARELSELMGGLPLALEQAGAYIETTGRSVSGYRDLYNDYRSEIQLYQYGEIPNYRDPVAFAWTIARRMVQQENAAAIELLHFCAFLAPEAIPYDLFTKGAHLLGSTLGTVAANPLAFDRAIALLRKHSLIKNEVDRETDLSRLIVHPVLQEILKDSMEPHTQQFLAQRVVNAVAHALSFVEWQIMQTHARRCLSLIEHWQMSSPEVDRIRQHFVAQSP